MCFLQFNREKSILFFENFIYIIKRKQKIDKNEILFSKNPLLFRHVNHFLLSFFPQPGFQGRSLIIPFDFLYYDGNKRSEAPNNASPWNRPIKILNLVLKIRMWDFEKKMIRQKFKNSYFEYAFEVIFYFTMSKNLQSMECVGNHHLFRFRLRLKRNLNEF